MSFIDEGSSPSRVLVLSGKHRSCHPQRLERDQRLSTLRIDGGIVNAPD
jgi:hypothetical protein